MPTIRTGPDRSAELLALIGDPAEVLRGLDDARISENALLLQEDQLLCEYAGKWIALRAGLVVAEGATLDRLFAEVDQSDVSWRDHLLVRYMDRDDAVLIL